MALGLLHSDCNIRDSYYPLPFYFTQCPPKMTVLKGPTTLATLFNHMWPRIVADPSTLGRHVCYVCKRSVCGGDEPQPVAHLSHKLQCARQSLKIMVSYGNKYPRHNARPHVVEQSGQCARALIVHPKQGDLCLGNSYNLNGNCTY